MDVEQRELQTAKTPQEPTRDKSKQIGTREEDTDTQDDALVSNVANAKCEVKWCTKEPGSFYK